MDTDYKKIGIRIKTLRKSKKMTQAELAEKIGLTNNYVSSIERASSKPSIRVIKHHPFLALGGVIVHPCRNLYLQVELYAEQ